MTDQFDDSVSDDVDGFEVIHPNGTRIPSRDEIDRVNAIKAGLEERLGVRVEEGDPEFHDVAWQARTPDAFLASFRRALAAKANRVGVRLVKKQPGAAHQADKGGALEAAYQRDVTEAVKKYGGGSHAVLEVRRKYRGKGLPV